MLSPNCIITPACEGTMLLCHCAHHAGPSLVAPLQHLSPCCPQQLGILHKVPPHCSITFSKSFLNTPGSSAKPKPMATTSNTKNHSPHPFPHFQTTQNPHWHISPQPPHLTKGTSQRPFNFQDKDSNPRAISTCLLAPLPKTHVLFLHALITSALQ